MEQTEERRPGLQALVDLIAKKHPKWPLPRVWAEAKVRWTAKQIEVKKNGVSSVQDNS